MSRIKLFKMVVIAIGFCLSLPIAARAQGDIKTPYTGKIPCRQILKLGANGAVHYYERKLNAEAKWAYGDYNRCKFIHNSTGSKKLSIDKQKILGRLRDALEIYFSSFYTMQAITVGGGDPFELDSLSSQSDLEDLISKAVLILSKQSPPRPALRKQAEALLLEAEKRLPVLTKTPEAKDFGWLDAKKEDDRETITSSQADHKKEADEMRKSLESFRALLKELPDSLALLSSQLLDNI